MATVEPLFRAKREVAGGWVRKVRRGGDEEGSLGGCEKATGVQEGVNVLGEWLDGYIGSVGVVLDILYTRTCCYLCR